jgi:hypothetical protein
MIGISTAAGVSHLQKLTGHIHARKIRLLFVFLEELVNFSDYFWLATDP